MEENVDSLLKMIEVGNLERLTLNEITQIMKEFGSLINVSKKAVSKDNMRYYNEDPDDIAKYIYRIHSMQSMHAGSDWRLDTHKQRPYPTAVEIARASSNFKKLLHVTKKQEETKK